MKTGNGTVTPGIRRLTAFSILGWIIRLIMLVKKK